MTIYELLTLAPAFSDSDRGRLLKRVAEESPPRPRQVHPAVPKPLERIVLKAILRDAEERYQSSSELLEDLRRYLSGRPVLARLPLPGYQVKNVLARHRRLAVGILALFLAAAAIFAWWRSLHQPAGTIRFAAVDLDRDGDADLVTVNAFSNSISVLLNSGRGIFEVARHLELDQAPHSIDAADFDADGKTDAAVAHWRATGVYVLKGDGQGSFAKKAVLEMGITANFLCAGDLDGDEDPDLAVTGTEKALCIFKNLGRFQFAEKESLETHPNPNVIRAIDLNRDGALDLVLAHGLEPPAINPFSHSLSVFLNQGSGRFGSRRDYDLGGRPEAFTAADLDGDGDPDLAVPFAYDSALAVLLNRGDGSFATDFKKIFLRAGPQSVAAADFNQDGLLDLAAAGSADLAAVLLGQGGGAFTTPRELPGAVRPASIQAVDLNGDGSPDLVVTDYLPGAVNLYLNEGKGKNFTMSKRPLRSWTKWLEKLAD